MRREMIISRKFAAAVIIGGMEGIFEEVELFSLHHPNAAILPLASTGAAAAVVHKQGTFDPELATNLTFSNLFRHKLQLS